MSNIYGRQVVVALTNKSGGGVIAGDVVIIDTSNNDAFTTTTSGAYTGGVGVAQETIASNASGRVLLAGYAALVNTSASVTRGNYGKTHTVVKQAADAGASRTTGTFCQFLTGGTTPTARVYHADLAAGAGAVATDAIWDAKGDLAGGTGADTAARLAVGANDTVLTADSAQTTGMKWAASSSGALVLLEQHTASTSATLDFTTFISSTYDEYLLDLVSIVPDTSDCQLRIRMGTGGGPTYDTGNNYGWNVHIARAGASAQNGADSGQAFIGLNYQAGGTLGVSATTADGGWSGSLRLPSPQSTSLHKQLFGQGRYKDVEPFYFVANTGGTYLSTTALTAIRFYYSTGNIASGTIRAYGVAK